jgi:hypothetical protein
VDRRQRVVCRGIQAVAPRRSAAGQGARPDAGGARCGHRRGDLEPHRRRVVGRPGLRPPATARDAAARHHVRGAGVRWSPPRGERSDDGSGHGAGRRAGGPAGAHGVRAAGDGAAWPRLPSDRDGVGQGTAVGQLAAGHARRARRARAHRHRGGARVPGVAPGRLGAAGVQPGGTLRRAHGQGRARRVASPGRSGGDDVGRPGRLPPRIAAAGGGGAERALSHGAARPRRRCRPQGEPRERIGRCSGSVTRAR